MATKPRNFLDVNPVSSDLFERLDAARDRAAAAKAAAAKADPDRELSPESQALREEYKLKKCRAIEESWAQKARYAGRLRPGRKEALSAGRTADLRFDEQPQHVQEAILASTAHDSAFDPDSSVIQLALQTKRALAEGRGAPDDQVVGFKTASKFSGAGESFTKRPSFPTHSGDFVWTSAEEVKELRDHLEGPRAEAEEEKRARKEKKEKKEKKGKKEKKQKKKKQKKPKPKLTKEQKLELKKQKEERRQKRMRKDVEKEVKKQEKMLKKLKRGRLSSPSSSSSSSSSSS